MDPKQFSVFAKLYGVQHSTSSPLFPQSNGQAERVVQIVKKLLRSDDPYMALLTHRSTPIRWCNFSPADMLMGRRLHSTLPMTTEQLTPTWSYLDNFRAVNTEFKQQQKTDFDRRHCSLPLPPNDTEVWVTSGLNITSGQVDTSKLSTILCCEYSKWGSEKK